MHFKEFGQADNPKLLLIHGLGVSWRIFLPIIEALQDRYSIITPLLDGHIVDESYTNHTTFTTVDDQAKQICNYIKENHNGRLHCAYGISLGGGILARVSEMSLIEIRHLIIDAGPILPTNALLANIATYFQVCNVWCTFHFNKLYRFLFRSSHYFTFSIDEVKTVYPAGGSRTIINVYHSLFNYKLNNLGHSDIHYWYGAKEAFMFKRCANHILNIAPDTTVEVFPKMNHAQLLIDYPEEVVKRIEKFQKR